VTAAPLAKKKRANYPDEHTKTFPKKSTESRGPINVVPKACRDLKSSYLILSILGEGASGKVYLSEDRINGQRCVVKMIKPSYKEEQDSRLLICELREEINLLKSICHENIVLLKDVVTHTGTCMQFSLVVLLSMFSFAYLLLLFRYGTRVPGV
jgi:serine/threonine protein kinase